ncbi:hypothetical protein vBAspATola_09 [Aeromonas phage vB_AspA_Tola]|nr:hypothetical protein vBAspATola_09 [Aeromonas phage vB_AspA_Tola]
MSKGCVLAAQEVGRRMQREQDLKYQLINHLLITEPNLSSHEVAERVKGTVARGRDTFRELGLEGF